VRKEPFLFRLVYGGKDRGPIGKPVRIFAGIVGAILMLLCLWGLFDLTRAHFDATTLVVVLVFTLVGFLLLLLAFKAGPAPPGSRGIELARYQWAIRAQNLCLTVGFVGLAALKAAESFHARWIAPWIPPESHVLTIIFGSLWFAGLFAGLFASYYLAQVRDLGGR